MNLTILKEFRQQVYGCFERSQDALFNVSDALRSRVASPQSARIVAVGLLRAELSQST